MTKVQRLAIHRCWVDERPCEPLELLMPPLAADARASWPSEPERAVEMAQELAVRLFLPCSSCRGAEDCASKISGTRLGATERGLLLSLKPWGAEGVEAGSRIAPGANRSQREAAKRASRKLWNLGLLLTASEEVRLDVRTIAQRPGAAAFRRTYWSRTAGLSPFGEALVGLIRGELERGESIRWGDRPAQALRSVRETGLALVSRIASEAEAFRQRLVDLGSGHIADARMAGSLIRAAAAVRDKKRKK